MPEPALSLYKPAIASTYRSTLFNKPQLIYTGSS